MKSRREKEPEPGWPECPAGARMVPLTQGQFALVDAADFDWINAHKWYAKKGPYSWYARRGLNSSVKVIMHRVIMGVTDPAIKVDHINGNGLDNRRSNLRLATNSQNLCNRGKPSHNTSGYKGVSWYPRYGKWRATYRLNGKAKCAGYFTNIEDAVQAYRGAAAQTYGEFWRAE